MNTIEKTPASVDPILANHIKGMQIVTDTLFPRQKPVTDLLTRIRWIAAAQDGSPDTAFQALSEIEELALEAMGNL